MGVSQINQQTRRNERAPAEFLISSTFNTFRRREPHKDLTHSHPSSMHLLLQLGQYNARFEFDWEQLRVQGWPCYIWDYSSSSKPAADTPAIYRHVVEVPGAGIVTVYVGEGASLNGPEKYNVCYQYQHVGQNASRAKVRKYLREYHYERGWTEILRSRTPVIDLGNGRQRRFLQTTLITAYYWEHHAFKLKGLDLPEFLNEPF